jgi:hypothetical protein
MEDREMQAAKLQVKIGGTECPVRDTRRPATSEWDLVRHAIVRKGGSL